MDIFESKLNFNFSINQKILNLISQIDLYKGRWNEIEREKNLYLKELKRISTIESIGSSTRIEGATLIDKEIEELLSDIKISKLKTRDEQEVVGYYDTLEIIYENYDSITLTENYIRQLHQNLLKYSDKDNRHRGQYKTLSNQVVANYPGGIQKIIFNTTEVYLVESEMNNLISWTNEQFKREEIHPLLLIAHFVYEFLSIHPFQDGNGRLSRLLTTLLLLQNKYLFVQYVSFENLIEKSKKEYYQALMEGQKNRNKKDENISRWVIYFFNKIKELTGKLDEKYKNLEEIPNYLNPRQKRIKGYVKENQPVKFSDVANKFNEININTLKKDLQYLKGKNEIKTIGERKGTIYIVDEKNILG